MSYNNKLEQTGKKVASARRKYYGSFDYGSGLSVGQKGGRFSFGKKFLGGGGLDDEWIDEPDVQADIEKYWRTHPREAVNMGLSPFTGREWDKEALAGATASAVGAVGKLADELKSQQDKKDALLRRYNTFGTSDLSGITDNTALLSAFASTPLLSTPTAETFRDKSYGQDFMSALSAGVNGAMSTKSPWGALFGVADAATSIFGRAKARRNAEELAPIVKRKNLDFLKDYALVATDVDARNDFGRMLGYYNDPLEYAFGGPLQTNGGDYNGGLTYIDEGGRHEDNPYEGVPSGVDANGVPNLVEEGEIIWNDDYVFSDRLNIPEELKEKYKLGRGGKKVTFADAIAKLTKENNISPNDPITKDTTKAIVEEFIDAQEKIRTENQLEALEELDIAQMNDFLAQLDAAQGMGMQAPPAQQGMEMADYGMELPDEAPVTEGEMMPPGYAFGGHKFEEAGDKKGNRFWDDFISQLNEYKASLGDSALAGRYSVDRNFNTGDFKTIKDLENSDEYKAFTKYVTEHPEDADVQRYLKTLDARTGKKAKKLFVDGKLRKDWKEIYEKRRNDGLGGVYHLYGNIGNDVLEPAVATVETTQKAQSAPAPNPDTNADESLKALAQSFIKEEEKRVAARPKFEYRPTWQRDIPILGAEMDFLYRRLNRPDYSNADAVIDAARMVGTPVNIPVETIGDYRRRNPFDERYLVNLANQNRAAGVRTLTNTAGGNRAMDLLGAANLAHSNQADLGEIMRQAYLANRQDDAQVAEFNRGTNLYNMNAINQRNMAQASLNSQRQGMMLNGLSRGYAMRQGIKDAWDNDAMESFNSMLASIGAVGKENEEYNMLTSMAEQGYYPYYYDKNGIMQLARPAKKGGKLNRKKRRF